MKKITIFLFLISGTFTSALSQYYSNTYDSTRFVEKEIRLQQFKTSLRASGILIGSGLIALTDNDFLSNEEIAEERNEHIPGFHTKADNYLQYAPIAVVYGLNIAGVKGKNNFGNRTALLLKSELIMAALVFPTKQLSHELRPDGSSYTSFPSGHTAQAFVAATFMHKEFGHISPWYSIGAYTVASSVGILRILNNRHYASDVLVGAGIGILSTNIAYLTHKYKWSGKRKKNDLVVLPTYSQGALGMHLSLVIR